MHVPRGCKCKKTTALNIQEALKFIGVERQSARIELRQWLEKKTNKKQLSEQTNECHGGRDEDTNKEMLPYKGGYI